MLEVKTEKGVRLFVNVEHIVSVYEYRKGLVIMQMTTGDKITLCESYDDLYTRIMVARRK